MTELEKNIDEIVKAYKVASGLDCFFSEDGGGRRTAASRAIRDDTWCFIQSGGAVSGWVAPVYHNGEPAGCMICEHSCSESRGRTYARLLLDICRVRMSDERMLPEPEPADSLELFDENEAPMDVFPQGRALSEYVYGKDFSASSLKIFWKTVETKAGGIFINMLARRIQEAKVIYNEIMALAYCESDIMMVRVSAETLFHIIILTRFARESFDSRFYRLTFDTMTDLFEAETVDRCAEVMNAAFDTVCDISASGVSDQTQHPAIRMIMSYLEENYMRNVKVEEVARYVRMSPEYVSRLFRRETSYTVKWCLTNIRMRKAQELLTMTDMPIKDIGRAVGYSEIRSFYKVFSKHFGMTCSEFRARALIK